MIELWVVGSDNLEQNALYYWENIYFVLLSSSSQKYELLSIVYG